MESICCAFGECPDLYQIALQCDVLVPNFYCVCFHHDNNKFGIFSVCAPPPPPSLVGAYYLQPPDARAIFLHNDLLCKDTCSVTGGSITYWGNKKKISQICLLELHTNYQCSLWAVEPQPKKLLDEIWGSQALLVCSLEP